MKSLKPKILFITFVSILICQKQDNFSFNNSKILSVPDLSFSKNVYSGLDILEQMDFKILKDKKIIILTNHSAINKNGKHLLDLLKSYPTIKVKAILELEHGLWGIDDKRNKLIGREKIDPVHGARIIDLFEKYIYPPKWVFRDADILLVDFQDTGSRYTTYITTLSKVFESASDSKVEVMILDRPNPIRGDVIDGPVPREEFQSYESYHLLPIRHGMTLGEISILINEMGWIKDLKKVNLTVVPLSNWKRDMWFHKSSLQWRNPIPHIKNELTLLAYNGMDLFRGTNLNMGFGTNKPYLIIGAPWLEINYLLDKINKLDLQGVRFKAINYRPRGTLNSHRVPKYDGLACSGIEIEIINQDEFNPIITATSIMLLIHQLHPRQFKWESDDYIDKLFGSDILRVIASQNKKPDQLAPHWFKDVTKFIDFRKSYLLYE
jgi:uncharacterized protein YbbC (DUF1343 family)